MKKVLFVATVVQKHINVFHIPFLNLFQQEGYKTFVAASNDTNNSKVTIPHCDEYIEIAFKRNPLHPGNLLAYLKLKKLIENNEFDIVHCHTPVGGLLGRLAARKARKNGTRVLYTAHGFHFYKGAPIKNWMLYYPVEKICSYFTDILITINHEDYSLAKKRMKAKRIEYVPGVGIDLENINNVIIEKSLLRNQIGVPDDSFLLVSVGELTHRKNHRIILDAMYQIDNDKIHYAIIGCGKLKDYLYKYARKYGICDRVHFLGYRNDVIEIYKASNLCCFPSIQEGLPVALMEAMACGLPCVASKIRGNIDLMKDANNGFLCDHTDISAFANAIKALVDNFELCQSMGDFNLSNIEKYDIKIILEKFYDIYGL